MKVVLVAYGIKIDGKRALIDFALTNAESEKRWQNEEDMGI